LFEPFHPVALLGRIARTTLVKAEANSVVRSKQAFTLIEVIVSAFVLSVASGAILLGLMLSLSQSKESQERLLAQVLAGSVVDELRAHPYGSTEPLPGWEGSGTKYTRELSLNSVIEGLPSPIKYELTVTPQANDGSAQDTVLVVIAWTEPNGPKTLQFKLPMKKGWNQAVSRGDQPATVAANWHEPAAVTIPSEPSYKVGDTDHSVNTTTPDAGNVVNQNTAKYQSLYNQLTKASVQLNTDQQAVSLDQQKISTLQGQLVQAQGAKKPDQALISQLQQQISADQGQLKIDQQAVTTDQGIIAGIKAKIAALD
jgi:prepilin-type N-terminal cleavage/methylation domain-containing protein